MNYKVLFAGALLACLGMFLLAGVSTGDFPPDAPDSRVLMGRNSKSGVGEALQVNLESQSRSPNVSGSSSSSQKPDGRRDCEFLRRGFSSFTEDRGTWFPEDAAALEALCARRGLAVAHPEIWRPRLHRILHRSGVWSRNALFQILLNWALTTERVGTSHGLFALLQEFSGEEYASLRRRAFLDQELAERSALDRSRESLLLALENPNNLDVLDSVLRHFPVDMANDPDVQSVLADIVLGSYPSDLQEQALFLIGRSGVGSLPLLRSILDRPTVGSLYRAAFRSLAATVHPEVVPILVRTLSVESPVTSRRFAAIGLGRQVYTPEVGEALIMAYYSDPDSMVRKNAVHALIGHAGYSPVSDALRKIAKEESGSDIRLRINRALESSGYE